MREKTFSLVLGFYSADDSEISMAMACISAYVKKHLPFVEVYYVPILSYKDKENASPPKYVKRVSLLKPDLIALSIMSPHWMPLDPYLKELKNTLPDTPILIGGYQAILSTEETLNHDAVDYACVGDGELPITDLIRHLRGELKGPVRGIWGKSPNGLGFQSPPVNMEDLTQLPFPDYTIFEQNGSLENVNRSLYGPQDKFILPVMTGRGCPYRCTYCCNTPLLEYWKGKGKYIRKYDPTALIDELCRLRNHYGVECFEFWDELFMSNMKFVWEFLGLYKDQVGLPFSINSRVEKMDQKFCDAVAEAGCHSIWFGLESGCEEYRINRLGRKMTNDQIITAVRNAKNSGIQCLSLNIVGMPFESRDYMLQTLELNQIIKPDIFLFFAYIPLRGTPLYKLTEESGLLIHDTPPLYQSWVLTGKFRLNIKEHLEGVTNEEFNDVCMQMKQFQDENMRLTL